MDKIIASISERELSSGAQLIIFSLSSILAGILWTTLSPLQVWSSGSIQSVLRHDTEPVISALALLSIYGLILLHRDKFGRWGRWGYSLLFGGFLLVGLPAALHRVVFDFPGFFVLGHSDTMLFTTLFGVLMIYLGFMLLGVESSHNDYAFGRTTTYVLLGVLPAGVGGFFLATLFNLSIWVTPIVAPAGVGLIALGVIINRLPTNSDSTIE